MSQNDNAASRLSYSGRHADLGSGTPISLREVKPASLFFNDEADPFLKKQREAMQLTEKERRDAMDQSSLKIKLDKPFPELKPDNAISVKRSDFNREWLKAHRRLAFEHMQSQRQLHNQSREQDLNAPTPSQGLER